MASRLSPSVLCAAVALLTELVSGVRLAKQPAGVDSSPVISVNAQRLVEGESLCSEQGSDFVPKNRKFFREAWTSFMVKDDALEATQVKGKGGGRGGNGHWPRIVLGIFSKNGCADAPYRDVIRSTWMQHPSVCPLSALHRQSECRIFATFVLGNKSVNGSGSTEPNSTMLPVEENLDCGKTLAWFRHAAASYKAATHIVKMDMDAFPHLSHFVSLLQNFSSPCKHVYGGRSWTACGERSFERCGCGQEYCPGLHCGHSVGTNFLRYQSDDASCFSYMQGGFYFMTRKLASRVAQEGGWWDAEVKNCHPEDITTGHAIQKYAVERGICVAALKFDGWDAYWHPDVAGHWESWGHIPWRHGHPPAPYWRTW